MFMRIVGANEKTLHVKTVMRIWIITTLEFCENGKTLQNLSPEVLYRAVLDIYRKKSVYNNFLLNFFFV